MTSKDYKNLGRTIYDAFRTSNDWHQTFFLPYDDLSDLAQRQINNVVRQAYDDIFDIMINETSDDES